MGRVRALFVGLMLVLPAVAPVAAGEWRLGARAVSLQPRDSSSLIPDTGSQLGVDSAFSLELNCSYRVSWNWALELSLTGAGLDLAGRAGMYDGSLLGDTRLTLPTVTAIYRLDPLGRIAPYMGAGLSYASFSGSRLRPELRNPGLDTMELSNGTGIAFQAGMNIELHDDWLVNLDVKYVRLGIDIAVYDASGTTVMVVRTDINPWIFGLGAAYRF